ncbi:hypothetical protein C8Q78DRAFT_500258 [Trametes maxima]|nr:hypothetical protein C8Q78DRAFT_500258 [Trametes maxima]
MPMPELRASTSGFRGPARDAVTPPRGQRKSKSSIHHVCHVDRVNSAAPLCDEFVRALSVRRPEGVSIVRPRRHKGPPLRRDQGLRSVAPKRARDVEGRDLDGLVAFHHVAAARTRCEGLRAVKFLKMGCECEGGEAVGPYVWVGRGLDCLRARPRFHFFSRPAKISWLSPWTRYGGATCSMGRVAGTGERRERGKCVSMDRASSREWTLGENGRHGLAF